MAHQRAVYALSVLFLLNALVGCGGSGGPSTPLPVSVTFSVAPPSSLEIGATQPFIALVANDPSSKGVTWTVTCSTSSTSGCGSFSPAQTLSGVATTYTAPLRVSASDAPPNVTVVVTSVANHLQSFSAVIAIAIPNLSLSFSLNQYPPNALQVGKTALIAASVSGDPTNQGLAWSCTPVNACGSFSPANTASGAATTYTAPANIPYYSSSQSVTITATSVAVGGDSVAIPIFVSSEPTTLADGTYIFSLSGVNNTGPAGSFDLSPYFASGAFTLSGGVITSGEEDLVESIGAKHVSITKGSYYATDDGNLFITLSLSDPSVGVDGSQVLDAAPVSPSQSKLIEYDLSATASGSLDVQTSTAAPSGGYAFFTAGQNSSKSPVAIGGILNIDGPGSISGTGSVLDINDSSLSAPLSNQSLAPSIVSGPDSFGRVVLSLTPSSAFLPFNLVGYKIDDSHLSLVETIDAYGGLTGGVALGQGNKVGSFSASLVFEGVFGAIGTGSYGYLNVAADLTVGAGLAGGVLSFNDLASQTPAPGFVSVSGSSRIDATGRVTFSVTDNPSAPTFTYNFQLYLSGNNEALLISMDKAEVLSGLVFQQASSGLGDPLIIGHYIVCATQTIPSAKPYPQNLVGPVLANGEFSGFADFSNTAITQNNLPIAGGLGQTFGAVFSGENTGFNLSAPNAPQNVVYYQVDGTRILFIEMDSAQLTLGYLLFQQ
jgi:hypothetical protein